MTQKCKTNQTTSKIYKLYINGKTKRPGTHQYHYLGPKVTVVVGKLDPTVGQICFRRIFQTVRNLRKRTTGMSLEGPKMGGRRYGSAWNGRKMVKSDNPPWPPPPRSPTRSGRVWRRFVVKFHGQGHLVVALLPGRRVYQGGGRKRLPLPKPVWLENESKRPSSGSTGFGEFFFLGFLELKMSVLGLGFYLARKTRFI